MFTLPSRLAEAGIRRQRGRMLRYLPVKVASCTIGKLQKSVAVQPSSTVCGRQTGMPADMRSLSRQGDSLICV